MSKNNQVSINKISTQKAKDFKGTLKRLIMYLKTYKSSITLVIIAAILSSIFSIVSPKILGQATTKIFEGVMLKAKGQGRIDFAFIYKVLIILVILYIISSIFNYMQQYIIVSVAQKTVYDMRQDIYNKLNRLPLNYFDTHTYGEVLSKVTNDIDNISSTLQQSMTQLITSIVTIVGVVIMMLTISPIMTLVTVLTIPLGILFVKPIISRSQSYFIKQQNIIGNLNGHIEEVYTGHEIIKSFNREKKSIDTFRDINIKLYENAWKAQFMSGMMMPIMNFVSNIGYVFVSVIGAVLVTKGRIKIGDIQAFIQYTKQFSQPISQTANIANIIQSTVASAERIFELLDEKELIPDIEKSRVIKNPKGKVVFDHVKFGYSEDKILIQDMNLEVNPGQKVAIVGPTGAGKTTLINLLLRFYELNGGKILIDDIDIRDMRRSDLRKMFGMVLQDTWLFKGTIRENIAYGKENSTKEEIENVARSANANHFIKTLPKGYDTIINEEGSNISQGQKQLLTIARAMISDPKILILDEATSSIDTRTELNIQKAMDEIMVGRTSFVIAHRLSTIKDADIILVMKDGNVIESGNHKELIEKGGFYSELYNSQFNK
ncbi:ABC transporter-like protein,Probable multidrug resistance ABC transporter ATP-binding/permease protein YheH,cyclic beta-1,2-glucan ABC transporter,ABC-type bacteriocin/lantibiotic exporters, contain an N-terminal double-glycine peptidase domain,lipid A export permease/ATP-binding protein MsbA,ABC transporter transmembrane region [[Clostridium] sordellii]|uniref:ABC transporter ATP-binding protein n=1 Tax=Paraclostridium sordellii TaxID=1505 RepID=UPI000543C630|nr:ABC transporter ATP-binding protein [Paeniclostridium sordellii]CEK33056.1 ABC transporter-like protein,Probable multidrug resistance ABC transporter ATP-binding/permease protein YheH,cyclic beta-1,2-glucan ABC transporter,ABC-type bacteriocin/lantibiotic exporters, contain an N-terminal double-glycine peptidase domain,lipid A export permease/ATP-binding protein MsbA,ABC transporter transmembrane region [[Clostridium] sordellii] [Paeniclostridium sordellii]